MYAMTIAEDKSFVWKEVAEPVCKAGEIIIEIKAAALNRADLMQRAGDYPPPPGWPEWPGLEVSGIVADANGSSRWKKGDKVCALLGGGGYAEKVVVPEIMVLPMPENLTFVQSAVLPEVYSTVYLNFFMEAKMEGGEAVFIQAGASGLGIAAIQIAKLMKCKVITTIDTPEKAETVKRLGADVIINYKKENIPAILAENPVDIALDCVGGPLLGPSMVTMNPWGRWIVLAALGGTRSEIEVDTMFKKRLRIIGSTLRSRTDEVKAEILLGIKDLLWDYLSKGELKPEIYKVFDMADVTAAHAVLENNENTGKVVLTIGEQ